MRRLVIVFATFLFAISTFAADERDPGTAFAVAIEDGDIEAIRKLLKQGNAADTPIASDEHKITPLIKAAWDGESAIVELLLEAGADVNAKATDTEETALMNAVTREHSDIVRILLKAKADITPLNSTGFNAFTSAVAAGNHELAGALLDAGAKIEDGAHTLTPLQFAAASGNVGMIRFLVSRGADVNHGAKSGGQTALLSAIYGAQIEAVKTLIELKADVNAKTKQGDTALKIAQKGDQEEIIQLLKAAGAKG